MSKRKEDPRISDFLSRLNAVTNATGLRLESCSCCNGINLVPLDADQYEGFRYKAELPYRGYKDGIAYYICWDDEPLDEDEVQ